MEHDTLTQPILLDESGEHTSLVHAAALASLGVFLTEVATDTVHPSWEEWLAGSFTKVARRARAADLKALASSEFGQSAAEPGAIALRPMRREEQPRLVARAQIAGTDRPRDHDMVGDPSTVTVHVLETLTTGKAAAQAAHALWLWALPQLTDAPEGLLEWWSHGAPLLVRLTDAASLADLETAGGYAIRDAGRTEIEPNTLTAVAVPTAAGGTA